MSVTGLKIVSVYDPTTGIVVQCNNVSTEGEFSKTSIAQDNSRGSQLYCADDAKFECYMYDDACYAQLYAWMVARTPVCFVTYGIDTHILWYEPTPITVEKDLKFKTGSRNAFKFSIARKGPNLNIKSGVNLLHLANGFGNSTNGLPANYTKTGTANLSFDGSNSLFTINSSTSLVVYFAKFIYPVANINLSAVFYDVEYDGANKPIQKIVNYNFANVEINPVFTTADKVDFITPANTYYIHGTLVDTYTLNAGRIDVCLPYIGVDRKIANSDYRYINY